MNVRDVLHKRSLTERPPRLPLPFQSERAFEIVKYRNNHGPLLISARREHPDQPRVRLLFLDVRLIDAPMWMRGLKIEEKGLEFLNELRSNPFKRLEPGLKVYALTSESCVATLVAGAAYGIQDNKPDDAPDGLSTESLL